MPPPQLRDLEREVFGGSDSEFSDDDDNDGLSSLSPFSLPHPFQTSSFPLHLPSNPPPGHHISSPKTPLALTMTMTMFMKNAQQSQASSPKAQQSVAQMIVPPSASASERPLSTLTLTTFPLTEVRPLFLSISPLSPLIKTSASKLRLDMQIEAILKPKKANRHRKKKNNDEVLDSFADDEVARLREAMLHAADEDVRAKADKLPATAKLRLLAEVMETLRKSVFPCLPHHLLTFFPLELPLPNL